MIKLLSRCPSDGENAMKCPLGSRAARLKGSHFTVLRTADSVLHQHFYNSCHVTDIICARADFSIRNWNVWWSSGQDRCKTGDQCVRTLEPVDERFVDEKGIFSEDLHLRQQKRQTDGTWSSLSEPLTEWLSVPEAATEQGVLMVSTNRVYICII